MGDQNQPLDSDLKDIEREIKRADQLQPGDVIVDEVFRDGEMRDYFRRVLVAEPIDGEPGRVLVVFVGAETHNVRCTEEYALATDAEFQGEQQRLAEVAKRARMRAGLMKLVDALDEGMPLPSWFRIDAGCAADEAAVRRAAEVLGVECEAGENNGRPIWEANANLAQAQTSYREPEVSVRVWHLARKAVES